MINTLIAGIISLKIDIILNSFVMEYENSSTYCLTNALY